MNGKQRPSLSELKVGIFVVAASLLLGLAIFAIGSEVGLFQDQFWAMTYLSNVSGLKPGDIVLLAGVEVGNVSAVTIFRDTAGTLPRTERNQQSLGEIERLQGRLQTLTSQTAATGSELQQARELYQRALEEQGIGGPNVEQFGERVEQLERRLSEEDSTLREAREDLDRERRRLQNIRVLMRINSLHRDWIRSDSNISLGSIGLLGDKFIEISLGRTPDPPETEEITVEGLFWDDTREVVLITGAQQVGFQELITSTNDILANFEGLSRKAQEVMDKFERGEGTIGRFFNDPTIYNNLNETVKNAGLAMQRASNLMRDITQGPGTVPLLIQQREIYDNVASATTRLESVLDRIERGEGTLGRFVNDPAVYEKTDQVLANVQNITRRIDEGEGTLGRLSTEDELYVNLRNSLDQLNQLLSNIEAGQGTLGRLAKDEELYRNVNQLSSELVKLIYDFRQNPRKFLTIKFELF